MLIFCARLNPDVHETKTSLEISVIAGIKTFVRSQGSFTVILKSLIIFIEGYMDKVTTS